jgi:hypothetical protein
VLDCVAEQEETMTSIYVAGASADLPFIEGYMAQLRSAGLEITHDWCAVVRDAMAQGKGANSGMTREEQALTAQADLDGIARADIFWLLMPPVESRSVGAFVELGYVLSVRDGPGNREKPIIVVSGATDRSIFAALADVLFITHDQAFRYIVSMARVEGVAT